MGGSITLIVVFVGIAVGIAGLLIYRQRSGAQPPAQDPLARTKSDPAKKHHPAQTNPAHKNPAQTNPAHKNSAQKNPAQADPQKNQAAQWGVRITAPAKAQTCPQVRGLLGKEFSLEHKPTLPVKDCPYPRECECQYVKLFDRRKEERRSGTERRQAQRFEKGRRDRRSGKDRRKNRDVDWT